MLKGQDIVVLLALAGQPQADRSLRGLADDLGGNLAGVHRSLHRLADAGLYDPSRGRVPRAQALEFLIHGLAYVFPARLGEVTRGFETAWGAPPLAGLLARTDELPPVWPDPMGTTRGSALAPLHHMAIEAAQRDPRLRERLVLVDAIRGGDKRSRHLAADLLTKALADEH